MSGICNVHSMVFYLRKQSTNPFMFGIISNNCSSSMLGHKFNEGVVMQTRNIIL